MGKEMAMDRYDFLLEQLVNIEKITAPTTCLWLSLSKGCRPWLMTSRVAHTSSQNKVGKLVMFMLTSCYASAPFIVQNLFSTGDHAIPNNFHRYLLQIDTEHSKY